MTRQQSKPDARTRIARLVDRAVPAIQHRLDLLDELTISHRDDIEGIAWWDAQRIHEQTLRGGSFHYSALTRETWGSHIRGGYVLGGTAPPLFLVVPERNYSDFTRETHAWRVVVFGFARYLPQSLDADLLLLTGKASHYGIFRIDSESHDTALPIEGGTARGTAAEARRLAFLVAQELSATIEAFARARWT